MGSSIAMASAASRVLGEKTVAFIGDINSDGFGDIALGNPKADFIDLTFPQGPDAPGSDPSPGRRRDVGDVYVIYGNNFGEQ